MRSEACVVREQAMKESIRKEETRRAGLYELLALVLLSQKVAD
jgi:hypothetical protein